MFFCNVRPYKTIALVLLYVKIVFPPTSYGHGDLFESRKLMILRDRAAYLGGTEELTFQAETQFTLRGPFL